MPKSFMFHLVEFAQKHALFIVLITAVISIFLGYYALQIQVDPDVIDLLPEESKALKLLEEYGPTVDDDYIIVAVESEELFALDKLKALEEVITRIEKLPDIHGSINPFNFITFQKKGKSLRLAPMSSGRKAPGSPEELELFREKLTTDPLARGFVISNDLTAFCSIFATESLDDYAEMIASVEAIIADLKPHFKIFLGGQIPIIETTKNYLVKDVPKLLIMGILVILTVLYLSFKSRRSILLPLLVVALGTLWTLGTMSLIGFRITIASIMVPLLVLTLGSSYSIHILNQYYREAKVGSEDRKWIASAVSHINLTIFMASLTTIIGFASLLSATLRQIREFGIATSVGIIYAVILSIFFFPAVLSKLRTPSNLERDQVLKGRIASLMEKLSLWVIKWRFVILILLAVISVVFIMSRKKIRYQTDYISYFRKKNKEKVVSDNLYIVEKFGGFIYVYVTLTAPEDDKDYFLQPEVLREISTVEENMKEDPDVVDISSFTSYLKLMNYTMNGNFDIPEKKAPVLLLSRYFISLTSTPRGSAFAGTLANEDFTRLTIAFRIYDGERKTFIYEDRLKLLVNRIKAEIDMNLNLETRPVIWGGSMVALELSETLIKDQIKSVIISALLIFLLTSITFRSIKFGLFSLVPMLTGIMLNFILMAFLDIPLDVVTIMFSSVAIGVGVDDSIHLIIQYRRQAGIFHKDKKKILEHTLKTAGRPILLTSISLVAGLLVLAFSSFMPIVYFGILVSLALTTTTIGALIILPALLSL